MGISAVANPPATGSSDFARATRLETTRHSRIVLHYRAATTVRRLGLFHSSLHFMRCKPSCRKQTLPVCTVLKIRGIGTCLRADGLGLGYRSRPKIAYACA